MTKRDADPISLKDALSGFVNKNKLQKGLDKVSAEEAWRNIMGPAIAKYTEQVKLDGNRLIVRLNSSVLREELGYGKEKIIANLNEEMGREVIKTLLLR
ncbi:MAG: RNA-binding protein [Cytophagaceae bacterium]|nr:RNA-binding protein [Cytophagaceae bacterium]|tara:strand:+ start:4977 stop:5273 length:297 start_codon:yes stop_codon:yes gene_type:complete